MMSEQLLAQGVKSIEACMHEAESPFFWHWTFSAQPALGKTLLKAAKHLVIQTSAYYHVLLVVPV